MSLFHTSFSSPQGRKPLFGSFLLLLQQWASHECRVQSYRGGNVLPKKVGNGISPLGQPPSPSPVEHEGYRFWRHTCKNVRYAHEGKQLGTTSAASHTFRYTGNTPPYLSLYQLGKLFRDKRHTLPPYYLLFSQQGLAESHRNVSTPHPLYVWRVRYKSDWHPDKYSVPYLFPTPY